LGKIIEKGTYGEMLIEHWVPTAKDVKGLTYLKPCPGCKRKKGKEEKDCIIKRRFRIKTTRRALDRR
jgi:hypothetical protein